ncbi:MAG: nicotinate (nicotinamide) nucleotide adenylyltransferase [Thermoleophilia bacterium]|nr:nicotinate (nicotinamide) nucleotide adenylyltransferase [Thermoleophilia bacterium]
MTTTWPRLGVLGGSFDPPHLAHLAIASEAFHELHLERVLFVPAAAPPHKGGGERTSAATRLQLTSLAIDDDLRFTASGVEIEHGLVYTADTLRAVGLLHPGRDLVFIMGSDSLLQLETWHEPDELLSLCTLAVAPRPGDPPASIAAARERWGAGRVAQLDVPALDLSSSEIRSRVARRLPIRYLVPHRVEQHIMETGLYR